MNHQGANMNDDLVEAVAAEMETAGIERRTRADDIASLAAEKVILLAEVDRYDRAIKEAKDLYAGVEAKFQEYQRKHGEKISKNMALRKSASDRAAARIRSISELEQADLAERSGA